MNDQKLGLGYFLCSGRRIHGVLILRKQPDHRHVLQIKAIAQDLTLVIGGQVQQSGTRWTTWLCTETNCGSW